MYKGSCLCNRVKFEISTAIKDIVYCHCSLCRKAQGSAFATNGKVDKNRFTFISGHDDLTKYESAPGYFKFFCKYCGSPIMSTNQSAPDIIRVRLGSIDSDIKERPCAHIFATSKANWEDICDHLPQYEAYPPEH